VLDALQMHQHLIKVEPETAAAALKCLNNMLDLR